MNELQHKRYSKLSAVYGIMDIVRLQVQSQIFSHGRGGGVKSWMNFLISEHFVVIRHQAQTK